MERGRPVKKTENEKKTQNAVNSVKKSDEPIVSVVMPAYRCAATIEKAIQSVLIQSVPLELIVINDQSPDELDEIMKRFEADPRVHYMKNEKNLGAAMSRNRGVAKARGAYVAFLDADDWWAEDKLEKQLKLLKETDAVLCCTGRELITPDGVQTGRVIPVRTEIRYRMMLHQNWINCSSAVLKTEAAKAIPMAHEDGHEDYILWLKLLKKYGKAVAVNEPLLKYRLSTKGKSGNKLHSAKMTYHSYRYAGLSAGKSLLCFIAYALNGVWKYLKAYLKF